MTDHSTREMRAPVRLLSVAAVAAGTLALGVPSGWAATPDTPFDVFRVDHPEPQANSNFGTRVIPAEDLTGDGVTDMFVDSYQRTVGGRARAGKVYLFSGADRSLRYELNSPEVQAQARFGIFISVPGDVNGDGKDDVAVGTDAQDSTPAGEPCSAPPPGSPPTVPAPAGCNRDQGKVWVFSGPTGRLLYAIDNPKPQANGRFGSRIGRAGDLTGDGRPDLVVGAVGHDLPANCGNDAGSLPLPTALLPAGCRRDEGEAFIFDGATGALVRTLNIPPEDVAVTPCSSNCGGLGHAVQGVGDTDGDGVTDQLVDASSGAGGVGRMYLFSGATYGLLHKIDDPDPQPGAFWGFDVPTPLAPGDVNGDGFADLYGHGFSQDGPAGADQGNAWIFNGRTGAPLYEIKDPNPHGGDTFGFAMTKTDYNQDGTPDVYVGSSPHHPGLTPDPDQNGESHIFNGKDGSLLKSLPLPESDRQPTLPGNSGPNFGIGVAAPGDLNRDGQPDYVSGAFLLDVAGNVNQGGAYFFYSRVPGSGPPAPGPSPTGAGTPSTGDDRTPPLLELGGRSTQRVGRAVVVTALTDEDAGLAASGRVAAPRTRPAKPAGSARGKAKVFRLPTLRRDAPARTRVTLRLRVSRRAVAAIKARLRRGRRATARITVLATDRAGNERTAVRTVRIKR